MKKRVWIQILFVFFLSLSLLEADDFSKEEAFKHVKHLADTIGPRPMGSPQEKMALAYTADRLAEYGCRVEWQYISQSERVNTSSGNVIGRLSGLSEREIVIGAHIDSSGPEIPGANDDGSGVALLIELARVFSQKPHHSTLVFAAFGGEESGKVGSEYFVEHYPLDNVALMLQLDMASNDSPLMLWLETKEEQSPRWLVSASIDAFHSLGYKNIDYPTHFQSLNSSLDGGSSDHAPFLAKGIPAIAFVSDVTFPIHTRNDSVEYFQIDGLERSGKLIAELIRRFDQEQPAEKTGHYMLFLLNEKPLFISPQVIVAFIILSLIIAGLALFILRSRRTDFAEDKKIKLSWPKLSILLLIILIAVSASEWVLKWLKGQRFFWYAHPGAHFFFIIPFALLGIWLALQTLWKWRLRKDAFFYLIRGAIYLGILVVLAWMSLGARVALYPAAGLLLISLACLVPWAWLKGILWFVSPYMMLRILFIPEYYEFAYRSMVLASRDFFKTPLSAVLMPIILILLMLIWSMPFMLGFAAIYRSYSGDIFWLKRFRGKISLVPLGALIIGGAIYLSTLPSYTSTWEQVVAVNQMVDSEKNKTFIEFASADYLKGIEVRFGGREESLNIKKGVKEIEYPLQMDWIKDKVFMQSEEQEEEKIMNLDIMLEFEKQPFAVTLRLECDDPVTVEESNVKYRTSKDRRIGIRWYSFPSMTLNPNLKLKMPKQAQLKATIQASFLETPIEISCSGENKDFIHRAVISREIDLTKSSENRESLEATEGE